MAPIKKSHKSSAADLQLARRFKRVPDLPTGNSPAPIRRRKRITKSDWNRISKARRKGKLEELLAVDPRGPPKPATHSYFFPNKMPESAHTKSSETPESSCDSARALKVEKLFRNDFVGLAAYGASLADCPLEFKLVKSADKLSEVELQTCLEIVEHTSGADYRASSIGWKPAQKKEEMKDKDMMYLLVRHCDPCVGKSGRILGFMSFMFTYDDPPYQNREVVYLYEIHLLNLLRGRGLGSRLVAFLEAAARHCRIRKTMLTVFCANEGARRLYEKLGYVKDSCSPADRRVRQRVIKADYVIMSKELA